MASQELTVDYLQRQDCVLIVTDHSGYDWNWIAQHASLIVDTRNALKNVIAPQARIVPA
jgi:UDP-N-acetyl-D-glucosamine dehydrogenase